MTTTGYAPLADLLACRDLPTMRTPLEPSAEPEIRLGTLLDRRFVVREIISRSRRSTIYRAEDLDRNRRDVAVKMPLLSVECDAIGFAAFAREEQIGLSLNHPGLLRFEPIAKKTGRPHFVTEYLDGCTLADLLHETSPLTESDALQIIAAVCDALEALHASGYVHRDLKPANIVLCRDLSLRIIDFGESAVPERRRAVLSALTSPFGTPEYMAPEQFERGPADERTDLYAVGVILYEMLTGEPPFRDDDPWKSAYRRTTGDPLAPRILNPAISGTAEEITLRLLRRDPAERYESAREVRADVLMPDHVAVTGLVHRLRAPRWKLSFHGTPLIAGLLLGIAIVAALAALGLLLAKLPTSR